MKWRGCDLTRLKSNLCRLAANDLIQASASCQVSLPTLPRAGEEKNEGFFLMDWLRGVWWMTVLLNGEDNHVKGALIEPSCRIYYRFVTTPRLLLSAPLSAVRTLGENGPMFSGARASSERRKLPDVRRVCRLIGGGGNRRPSHRKETLLVFVTQTTKDQAPDVALCPVIVSSNVGIPVWMTVFSLAKTFLRDTAGKTPSALLSCADLTAGSPICSSQRKLAASRRRGLRVTSSGLMVGASRALRTWDFTDPPKIYIITRCTAWKNRGKCWKRRRSKQLFAGSHRMVGWTSGWKAPPGAVRWRGGLWCVTLSTSTLLIARPE